MMMQEFAPPLTEAWIGVAALGAPTMREEGEVGAQSLAPRRRSPRLIRKEELSACASEQDLILKLKAEMRDLRKLRRERLAREGLLGEYMLAWLEDARKNPTLSEKKMAGRKRLLTPEEMQQALETKRKKVVETRVPEKQIEYMILNRTKPFEGICEETEVGKRSRRFRELYAEQMAVGNKLLEYERALIEQFRTKGYAYDYEEVTDDDEEN
ncbi:unnamed protein product [Urochloa humidicola]